MIVAITWIDTILAIYDDIFDEISQSIEICLTVLGKHLFNIDDYQADWNADFLDNTCQVDKEFLDNLLVLLETWKDVTARTSYVISVEIERFYFDLHWAIDKKDIALTWLDELLVIAKCHNDYRFDNILKIKIQALHALNQPTEQLIDEYLHLPAICALKVGRLLDNGEVQKAVQLIKETIQIIKIRLIGINGKNKRFFWSNNYPSKSNGLFWQNFIIMNKNLINCLH